MTFISCLKLYLLSCWDGVLPAAADNFVVQVGRESFQVHVVVNKHKLHLPWSAQIWNTQRFQHHLAHFIVTTRANNGGTEKRIHRPSGRKVSRLAAIESWLRRWSQQSCRGTWLSRLWSAVRFCSERQRCSRSGRDISWFIDTSSVSKSCRSPISAGVTNMWEM